jgi:hypothetical protein
MAAYDLADVWAALRTTALTGTAGTTYTGGMWWGQAQPEAATPYVTGELASLTSLRTFAAEGFDLTVQLSLWHGLDAGAAAAAAGAAAIRANVGRTVLSVTGLEDIACYVTNERGPLRDNDLWRVDLDLTIQALEA